MTKCTLLFLINDNQVLLAMKKRGIGEGHWNGAGGKLEPGETWSQAVVRECQEEIDVTPIDFELRAKLTFDFYHKGRKQPPMYVQVYVCPAWTGKPEETEEMMPKWFNISDLPLKKMWDDDKYWLPQVLAGKKLEAYFDLDADGKVTKHEISIIKNKR